MHKFDDNEKENQKELEFSQKTMKIINTIKQYCDNGGDYKIIEKYYNKTGSYSGIEEYLKEIGKISKWQVAYFELRCYNINGFY